MIKFISDKLFSYMRNNTDIPDDMVDVYRYGIEITISSILNILLIVSASLLMGHLMYGIVFLLFFIPLRSYCGGYHATTYFRCNMVFLLTYIAVYLSSLYLTEYFNDSIQLAEVLLLLAFLPILIFSPVKNVHKTLSEKTAKKCRILSFIIYIVLALTSMYFCFIKSIYGAIMVMTLVAISVMILVEIFMQRRGYHETEKNCSEDDC